MHKSYEEAYNLFINYIKTQIQSTQDRLKNIEQNSKLRRAYRELQGREPLKFIENYSVLSKVNPTVKENLDIIDYLVKNGIKEAPQMDEAINNVLTNQTLLKLVTNPVTKEILEGILEQLQTIIDGTYDFETFKNALLSSNLDDEDILTILDHKAEETYAPEKKQLPSLEDIRKNEIVERYQGIATKINELLDKYYYLIEGKSPKLIELYRKTLKSASIKEMNEIYQEEDVLLCIHLLHLLELKGDGDEIFNVKPIDYSLIEISVEELTEAYEDALVVAKEYDELLSENESKPSNVCFLDRGIDVDRFSSEEKSSINSILSDLEMGLFDYERNKTSHTIVRQTERKDLNVFVNRRRNMAVSYIRVNSEDIESKVVVLAIDDIRRIFDESKSVLRTNGKVIDETVSRIKENDTEFISELMAIRDEILSKLKEEEVTHHE